MTVPGANGRTFKWTDGRRTVGTLTEVWASASSRPGNDTGTSRAMAEQPEPRPKGACDDNEDEEQDGFISVAALLDALQLPSEEQAELLGAATASETNVDDFANAAAAATSTLSDQEEQRLIEAAEQILAAEAAAEGVRASGNGSLTRRGVKEHIARDKPPNPTAPHPMLRQHRPCVPLLAPCRHPLLQMAPHLGWKATLFSQDAALTCREGTHRRLSWSLS